MASLRHNVVTSNQANGYYMEFMKSHMHTVRNVYWQKQEFMAHRLVC